MSKNRYEKPTITVIDLEMEQSILAGSGIGFSGLEDEFYYDPTPGDGSDAY